MELKKYQNSNNKNQMLNLNNPLETKPTSNFTRTNTYLPQSSHILNNPLMSKDPLQSNNLFMNRNINMPNQNINMNLNMMNVNNMNTMNNLYNQSQNTKQQKQNVIFYTIKYGNEKYNLSIECNNIYFYFKLEPLSTIIFSYYKGEFNLSTIINKLNVVINNHNAYEQLNKIVEKAINEDSIKIINDKQRKKMILRFNKNNFESSDFELEEVSNDKKLFHNIFEELNLLKFQQLQYMTLFKNNNFISNKDAVNLIHENNIKNDFDNKIKNIDSICNSQKSEIQNLKKELTDTKNDFENKIKNVDLTQTKNDTNNKNDLNNNENIKELKTEITNIKNDLDDKIKKINLNEIKNEINQVKSDFENELKNINFSDIKNTNKNNNEIKEDRKYDELKNEIKNSKEYFENKIKNINLDEFKNEINDMKKNFANKLNNINLDEIKQEVSNLKINLEDKFKNIKLDEINTKIDTIKNDLESKLKNINIDDIKNEINLNKTNLETKIDNINLTEINSEISNLKNDLEIKLKNINTEEIKNELTQLKSNFDSKIKSIYSSDNENKTEINNIKNELNNTKVDIENKITNIISTENIQIKEVTDIKTFILQLKEIQTNLNNENTELKNEIHKIKEEQTTKENELKNEILLLKDENEKLKSENQKIKEEIQSQNIQKNDNSKINEENEKLSKENTNKIYEEISTLKEINNQIKEDKLKLEKELTEIKTQLSLIVEKEKKKEEKKKLIEEKKEKLFKEQISHKFTEAPERLKNKFDILKTNNIFFIDEFAVYISITDKKEYLASGNKTNYNIDIYDIRNNLFYTSLKAHKNGTPTIRYFLNNKKNKEYLISADFLKTVIVWDIGNEYNILLKIESTQYKGSILSTVILFDIKTKENEYNDYIITSSDDENEDFSKVFSFKDGSFIKNISNTNKNTSYYLLPWEYKNNYYIIELCLNKISINNLLTDENYAELVSNPESSHFGGFIYDEKFLCCSSENGQVRIWNLDKKFMIKKIEKIGGCYFEIIPWNEKFVITANYKNNSFDIFDIEKGELVRQVSTSHIAGVRAVKKIYLPNYGECLITSGHDSVVKMWSI